MKLRTGIVCLGGQRVGRIEETRSGARFSYDPDWLGRPDAAPVSLTLPLAAVPYEWPDLHPFFENLLPEGWFLEIAVRKLKIARDDPFGLLLATCGDCAGAVEVHPA